MTDNINNHTETDFSEGSDHALDDHIDEDDELRIEAQHLKAADTFGISLETTTTFRDDVRNEWIHAVFGADFPECHHIKRSQHGMGLARIAPYIVYRTSIPTASLASPLPPSATNNQQLLGISIARLALGLYVRHVDPGSEAWCAGIVPHSVLVSINGMSLLAEPSKQALERLWQYEGFLHVDEESTKNSYNAPAVSRTFKSQQRPPAPSSITTPKVICTPPAKHVPGADSLRIRQPLHMVLIYQGQLYSVVLLSNPPYGIDWAPCGNFALVKRSYSHAHDAGVVKGSIIAKISSISGGVGGDSNNDDSVIFPLKDISEIDHTLAAETLRNLSSNGREIQLTLCIPPSEARSGHWERLLEAEERNLPAAATPTTKANGRGRQKQSMTAVSSLSKVQRPHVAAQLDGVEIRVHPLLFSNPGSPQSNPPSAAMSSLSHLAFRVAAGELFSFPRQGPHRRYQYYYSQRYYRPCPPLDQSLTKLISLDDALAYLLQYDKANYNEHKLTIVTSTNTSSSMDCASLSSSHSAPNTQVGTSRVLSFLKVQSMSRSRQSVETFLLQILALLRLQQSDDEDQTSLEPAATLSPLAGLLLEMASDNNSKNQYLELCHRMECIAQALELKAIKEQLEVRRSQQMEHGPSNPSRRKPRQIPIRVERAPVHLFLSPSASAVTGTTASAVTMSSIVSSSSPSTRNLKSSATGIFGLFRKKKSFHWRRKKAWKGEKRKVPSTLATTAKISTVNHSKTSLSQSINQSTNSALSPREGIDYGTLKAPFHPSPSPNISNDVLFTNTLDFLRELETVCMDIEKSLLRSFSQKIAGWALQPWSASKETELAQVTQVMRQRLRKCLTFPVLSPIDSDPLLSVDAEGSYILPSAHFPLLLTFNCQDEAGEVDSLSTGVNDGISSSFIRGSFLGRETMYRTKVELVELQGSHLKSTESLGSSGRTFTVHGSVGGIIAQSAASISTNPSSDRHAWDHGNVLAFDCRSSWGAPETLMLLVSQSTDGIVNSDDTGKLYYEEEVGYCFVNLSSLWESVEKYTASSSNDAAEKAIQSYDLKVWSCKGINQFDEHGDLPGDTPGMVVEDIEVRIKVTVQKIPLTGDGGLWSKKRSLLYKHDDDVRQELFAIEFIKSCDAILKSCGLDLKILTFRCIPVAKRRGFIEWIHGSVPLSEICQPFAGSILDGNKKDVPRSTTGISEDDPLSSVAKAGLTKYESLRRVNRSQTQRNKSIENPIQDYLRAFYFDPSGPYMIRKQVMDTYIKSCAAYCVITYILGVGDRHLDNLLLHPTGHFFHCDYSFILGHDPKKYLPLRITEDMVNGMGGRESDNYSLFLSLSCAAFLTFRRPENVRYLLCFVRLMEGCCTLPNSVDSKQALETAMLGVRERLRLDLTDDEAISFMEKLIEESCSSRMWLAVDAIHTLGKRF